MKKYNGNRFTEDFSMGTNKRRGSVVFPTLLIALGAIVLLNNLGTLDLDLWDLALHTWPLLLIISGLDILLWGRSPVASVLAVVLIGAAITAGVIGYSNREQRRVSGPAFDIERELGGATRGSISTHAGVGTLALQSSDDRSLLIYGALRDEPSERVSEVFRESDGHATYVLRAEGFWFYLPPFSGDPPYWDLEASSAVPLSLDLNIGMGSSMLDLSDLQISGLRAWIGVGRSTITLPVNVSFNGKVSSGVGLVKLFVPEEVGLALDTGSGVYIRQLPSGYIQDGDTYYSPGFDASTYQIHLDLELGLGGLVVETLDS
jgi:hypothetical protein